MALESVFSEKFEIALDFAYVSGRQGAWIQGMGNGLMNGMVYFVEGSSPLPSPLLRLADLAFSVRAALLFFMISDLMIRGSYTYATALRVFSLIVFSITFASQMLAFRKSHFLFPLFSSLSMLSLPFSSLSPSPHCLQS